MTKDVEIYVHGSRESMWELGTKLKLTGEVLRFFSFAAEEFKITLRVDLETGDAFPIAINDRELGPETGVIL